MQQLKVIIPSFLAGVLLVSLIWVFGTERNDDVVTSDLRAAEKIAGVSFTPANRDSMLEGVRSAVDGYEAIRALEMPNSVWPSVQFNPLVSGMQPPSTQRPLRWDLPLQIERPQNLEELAYFTVAEMAHLLQSRQITSVELTQIYLDRIERYDPILNVIVTLTQDLALEQASKADEEIEAGLYRGPLHGIPYFTKDLLALEGYPTTWGAMPYRDQVLEETATVIRKLNEAGAVHLAKVSLGALAWGDVWFKGRTNSPWNTEFGASGSSAGSSAGVAAGMAAFAIGSETYGSIVSPATRNGVSGLRPSYGRVSRHGAMALSWSMDKIGPITRSAEDAALVFNAIYGPDKLDPSLLDFPFNYDARINFSSLRIGYHQAVFNSTYPGQENDLATLDVLRSLGAQLVPIELPEFPVSPIIQMLNVEAAAAFDDLTRSGRDAEMVRQIRNAWPNVFRTARMVPAVEYIQASRARTLLQQQVHEAIREVDVFITPAFAGGNLPITNLTGHPSVVIPNGFNAQGMPTSITINAHLFEEGNALAVARAYQQVTDFHRQRPPLF
ncbi:MAG: amidase [Bacteroidetes bacterium]|nr:amidase [Bacteroidota bacterium]